jgi:hypothetical protein
MELDEDGGHEQTDQENDEDDDTPSRAFLYSTVDPQPEGRRKVSKGRQGELKFGFGWWERKLEILSLGSSFHLPSTALATPIPRSALLLLYDLSGFDPAQAARREDGGGGKERKKAYLRSSG